MKEGRWSCGGTEAEETEKRRYHRGRVPDPGGRQHHPLGGADAGAGSALPGERHETTDGRHERLLYPASGGIREAPVTGIKEEDYIRKSKDTTC